MPVSSPLAPVKTRQLHTRTEIHQEFLGTGGARSTEIYKRPGCGVASSTIDEVFGERYRALEAPPAKWVHPFLQRSTVYKYIGVCIKYTRFCVEGSEKAVAYSLQRTA